jgi:ribosomal protein S18 acetylase RimI-like enzyme
MHTDFHCRLLSVGDVDEFRQLRLRACREEPVAFTEAYEELASLPPEHFKSYFDNGWIAGAFKGNEMVGLAGLYCHKGQKVAHKGTVWGVYAAPETRGQGVARRLIGIVLAEAERAGLEVIHLSTDVNNSRTVGLYKSLGFEPWGIDKSFAKVSGRYIDEVMMAKYLKAHAHA